MAINTLCCGTIGAELKSLGMQLCTENVFDFTRDAIIFSWSVEKGSEANYFPLLTKEEMLDFFWYQNYAVCVKLENKMAWIQDQDSYVEFRNDDDKLDFYMETDYLARLLIIILKTRQMTISVVNNFFRNRTNEWIESLKIETNGSSATTGNGLSL